MYALPVIQNATPPRSVRLSLTDRCDLACIYCRPDRRDGYLDPEDRLDLEAWKTMVRGLVRAGVRRVRLTGGEPLLHPAIVEVVAFLGTLDLDDVALTTNATRLEKLARPLRDAGLQRINVSLDTLDADRFDRMTRSRARGALAGVLRGIDAALAVGFDEIKLNAVIVRGENDAEIESLVRWSWSKGIVPRLLEVMQIGEGANLADRVVTANEMRARLAHLLESGEALGEADRGPAKYLFARHAAQTNAPIDVQTDAQIDVQADARTEAQTDSQTEAQTDSQTEAQTDSQTEAQTDSRTDSRTARTARTDARKKVGFITGTSDTYCKGCDRLRVASDGTLRPCLATNDGLGAAHLARSGDEAGVARAVAGAWTMKPDGDKWKGCTETTAATVSMRGIGG